MFGPVCRLGDRWSPRLTRPASPTVTAPQCAGGSRVEEAAVMMAVSSAWMRRSAARSCASAASRRERCSSMAATIRSCLRDERDGKRRFLASDALRNLL